MDACAVLALLVYTERTAAAQYGPDDALTLVDAANDMGIVVCHQTSGTVSDAFTRALRFAIGKRTNGAIAPLAAPLLGVGAKAGQPRRL